jgi:hypothetical protein
LNVLEPNRAVLGTERHGETRRHADPILDAHPAVRPEAVITAWMVPPVLLAERLPGGFRGPAAGVYRVVADLAYLVSPGAVGWLVGRHGFRAAGLAMAGLFLAAAVTAVALLGRRPESA